MHQNDPVIHLLAGGIGGSVGALVTCPLEVVKTRLQSSVATFDLYHKKSLNVTVPAASTPGNISIVSSGKPSVLKCFRYIVQNEGSLALFKGLGPNLLGVAPTRAIYFCTYSQAKKFYSSILNGHHNAIIHSLSSASAGFTAITVTDPIWMVKTRLQLDQKVFGKMNLKQVLRDIYQERGLRGFYRGVSASYFGISETVIHFVIYEALKTKYLSHIDKEGMRSTDMPAFMLAGATSKTIACTLTYPHEVARTRLRQAGTKYVSFVQTLLQVAKEEGPRNLYRGFGLQILRHIPNTAIMMATYETLVYFMKKR